MGYHISILLALHEYLSHQNRHELPPFSFLVIVQPSKVYFPGTASGKNILDHSNKNENLQKSRKIDITAIRRILKYYINN
ncbi:TPA: DUF3732 domain-containing protein [Escherichia coli]|uniref:DUF3732 domain-containing protein n=1 Tax=Escherichia ruysiae TaxID=2608867 RepID=UPI000907115E|nr:DUF3732 domain-containing protein [Escherichia ruysiae]HAL9675886.1 DUF3732 domain-containing protein [Escherichia coli]HAV7813903.1 DUF3732 domain-containing protein [Escherichia coli]HAW5067971.1 DUF3732 domain-containing protein [Escherichia coli]HBC1286566.1 DUF3732 domain-containing protein [Escherichia coli]